jgi:hypothetical protein
MGSPGLPRRCTRIPRHLTAILGYLAAVLEYLATGSRSMFDLHPLLDLNMSLDISLTCMVTTYVDHQCVYIVQSIC